MNKNKPTYKRYVAFQRIKYGLRKKYAQKHVLCAFFSLYKFLWVCVCVSLPLWTSNKMYPKKESAIEFTLFSNLNLKTKSNQMKNISKMRLNNRRKKETMRESDNIAKWLNNFNTRVCMQLTLVFQNWIVFPLKPYEHIDEFSEILCRIVADGSLRCGSTRAFKWKRNSIIHAVTMNVICAIWLASLATVFLHLYENNKINKYAMDTHAWQTRISSEIRCSFITHSHMNVSHI